MPPYLPELAAALPEKLVALATILTPTKWLAARPAAAAPAALAEKTV